MPTPEPDKINGDTVRADFNHIRTVIHYTKAAHTLGLWKSERALIDRFLPDKSARLLEAGCGAGRVAIALWQLGYRNLTAFDFASELVEQAESLAAERGATGIRFLHADATCFAPTVLLAVDRPDPPGPSNPLCYKSGVTGPTAPAPDGSRPLGHSPGTPTAARPDRSPATGTDCVQPAVDAQPTTNDSLPPPPPLFDGALFMFNGLMQIPGRDNRRAALAGIASVCRPGAVFLFTTHDRDDPKEAKLWVKEAARWARGEQDPRLVEFGDRYFSDDNGNTFMHLPDRKEVLADLTATGWRLEHTAMRDELASETPMVRNFSDNCRFWVALRR